MGLLQVLNERLNMSGPGGASYYCFCPHPAWRILVLDGYDVSLLGWPEDHPLHQQARRTLDERNPNQASVQSIDAAKAAIIEGVAILWRGCSTSAATDHMSFGTGGDDPRNPVLPVCRGLNRGLILSVPWMEHHPIFYELIGMQEWL